MNTLIDSYLAGWKKYAVISGRARRREYWTFNLINCAILLILSQLAGNLKGTSLDGLSSIIFFMNGIFLLVIFVPTITVSIRRLHDTSRSAWWLVVGFIPYVGVFVLAYFFKQDGSLDINSYGPNPKLTA